MRKSIAHKNIAFACVLALAAVTLSAPVFAKSDTEHLRGTISNVTSSGFTVKTDSGGMQKVAMSSDTRIAGVTQSSLSKIKKGTFIGTANVKRNGNNKALEMVIFPPSMKGTGLGDYAWDLSPSDQKSGSSSSTASGSSMTNGTVKSESSGSMSGGSSMTNGTVKSQSSGSMSGGSSMTNGTVTKSSGSGAMTLKVDYGKGSKTIHVPADVPTVMVQKGSKSDIKQGAHVFVAGPQGASPFKAQTVIVGINGTVPPM